MVAEANAGGGRAMAIIYTRTAHIVASRGIAHARNSAMTRLTTVYIVWVVADVGPKVTVQVAFFNGLLG